MKSRGAICAAALKFTRTNDLPKSGRWDSNPRRPAWEAGILPTELRPHSSKIPLRNCPSNMLSAPLRTVGAWFTRPRATTSDVFTRGLRDIKLSTPPVLDR